MGPTLGPLINEFDIFPKSYYMIRPLSSLIASIDNLPYYRLIFDYNYRATSFIEIEEGLVNFLVLFKVDITTASTIAKIVVETQSITELIVFLKKYKLALEVELGAGELKISEENL